MTGSLMIFVSPLQLLVSSFAPMRRRHPRRPGPAPAAAPPAIGSCSYTGSPRFLENPSHTFAPLSDPGRSAQASPSRPAQCRPRFNNSEDTSDEVISGLNHAASVSATYASSRALPHAHARLASGWWLAFAGRESNPLDSIEKFPSSTSDFLPSQIYPGAMLKNSDFRYAQKIRRSAGPIAQFDSGGHGKYSMSCQRASRLSIREK